MTTREELLRTTRYLQERRVPGARLDAELLLAHALGVARERLHLDPDRPLAARERTRLRRLARQRACERVPLAYLIGEREFWSLPFRVSPEVLIPRPETETLVEAALELARKRPLGRVLELGVGSGAVTAALALELPGTRFVAVDRSRSALGVARENLHRLGLADRVSLLTGDLGEALRARFDLVLSNPPYVPARELARLGAELRHEPRLALDGGSDGLECLRRICAEGGGGGGGGGARGGVGGGGLAPAVRAWLELRGARATWTRRDLAGRERVVWARFGGG
ncbi:MAG: peptide chain release factor N(5)-glutamine methyltransferase [Myxococcota bacterium]